MKYKAILFDMDGVILDSEPLHVAAFQATLENYGYSLSGDDYIDHFAGRTDEAGFVSYFKFIHEEVDLPLIMDNKAKKYLELAGDQLVPYPGIVSLIKNLANTIPLALVTGSLRPEVEVALEAVGITDCFKIIISAEDVSEGKPSAEGYGKAIMGIGVPPGHCVAVEDSPSGVMAAINAGIEVIAITNTHNSEDLHQATIVVDRLEFDMF